MTQKNLEYYLNLPYKMEIKTILPEDGGGYTAWLPQFGTCGIVGDGETVSEAIKSLETIKKYIFKLLIKENTKIPEPIINII